MSKRKQRKQHVAWHRELLVNAIRYAAASPEEQQAVVPPKFLDRLGLLQDMLVHWEHAEAFAECVTPVLTIAEHAQVASFMEEVERTGDPATSKDAERELDRLRPIAIAIRDALQWEGELSRKVFPTP